MLDHPPFAHIGLGLCMEHIGEMNGVEPILIEGVRRVLQSLGASHPKYIAAREKVGEFYDRQGRPEAAVLIRDCATLEGLSSIVEQH